MNSIISKRYKVEKGFQGHWKGSEFISKDVPECIPLLNTVYVIYASADLSILITFYLKLLTGINPSHRVYNRSID